MMENYGKDADITWVMDHTIFHIVPIANPDGRVIVQNHLDWSYRKNARSDICSEKSGDGVDLNRNYPMFWGHDWGSSSNTCNPAYRGQSALSEPESQAIYNYVTTAFDKTSQKGTPGEAEQKLDVACDEDGTGVFMDVHSAGEYIYYPWGYEDRFPPNKDALLAAASKLAWFGNYQLWGPGSEGFLYAVSGDCTDTMYGQYCIASYGYELGTTFSETCEDWRDKVVPVTFQSFLFAAKMVLAPYKLPKGPDILTIESELKSDGTFAASVVASADMNRWVSVAVTGAKMYVDVFPMDDGAQGQDMVASDGAFNSATETATIEIDTNAASWGAGKHTLYFQATNADGFPGVISAVFVDKVVEVGEGDDTTSIAHSGTGDAAENIETGANATSSGGDGDNSDANATSSGGDGENPDANATNSSAAGSGGGENSYASPTDSVGGKHSEANATVSSGSGGENSDANATSGSGGDENSGATGDSDAVIEGGNAINSLISAEERPNDGASSYGDAGSVEVVSDGANGGKIEILDSANQNNENSDQEVHPTSGARSSSPRLVRAIVSQFRVGNDILRPGC